MADEASQIGKQLREMRDTAGLTQAEAAIGLGVDKVTISRWEIGTRRIKAEDFDRARVFYAEKANGRADAARKLGQSVPRGTPQQLHESSPKYYSDDAWAPNPALKNKIPGRAYETAIEYCRRLQRAGVARENIENAERLMIDSRYAQANKREKRELTEDDWILLVDDTWDAIRETLSWEGVRV